MRSTSGFDYALRAATAIARGATGQSAVTASVIAAREGIPHAYLAQILPKLVRAQLLTSARGYNGGYRLAAPAASITAADIARVMDGTADRFEQDPLNSLESGSSTQPLWRMIDASIRAILEEVTIADLAA